MFDANADGEGLWLHRHAPLAQHGKGIPRAVTGRKDDVARGENIVPLGRGNAQRAHAAAVELDIRERVGKAHLAAAVDDLAAQVLQNNI